LEVQIIVTFSEKRPKKSWFQVYMGEEDVPWEQWYEAVVSDPLTLLTNLIGSSMLKYNNRSQKDVRPFSSFARLSSALMLHDSQTAKHLTRN
jgi:hypothetical protein